ncbi:MULTISPECIES: acyl-CoA dehydrogenase family protein [unclassified Streptomyces]|uniref:acyl-CoA dehydrogenase family protein n=1 Tax=unclassified Streptomyces TaxID=2593676 RepID=UPI000F6C821E|nr:MULTISPECIES: acyl-CoA dehydrogenase family protein [unclassified Streptomyces]AZM59423.1 oxidoreductase [Streptomyces sp. WAC 01438]RSM94070.1 oxidoreductase [Streptomyces sp. WAC 01420]
MPTIAATPPPSRPDLVAAATGLRPLLAAHAERTESERRPTPENLDGLREAGLLRLTTPRDAGGHGADTRTQVDVLLELARACPSTAWVTAVFSGLKPMLRTFSARARGEFYADGPDTVACSVASPNGRGLLTGDGVRISGEWPVASGCEDAQWALLGVPVHPGGGDDGDRRDDADAPDGRPPRPATVLVPTADLSVRDTWHAAGMRGTGSQSLVADDALVPAHRVLSAAVAAPDDGTAAVFPAAGKLAMTLTLLAPVVGAALGARDVVQAALANGRGVMATVYRRAAESPSARMWLADAAHLLDRAVGCVRDTADTLDAALATGATMTSDPLTPLDRSRIRMGMVSAVEDARAAVSGLLDLYGTAGFSESNPLQRLWRDMETGSRHIQFNPFITREDHGRALLGIEPPVSLLL